MHELEKARAEHKARELAKAARQKEALASIERAPVARQFEVLKEAESFLDLLERKKNCRPALIEFWRSVIRGKDFHAASMALSEGQEFNGMPFSAGELSSSFPFFWPPQQDSQSLPGESGSPVSKPGA